MKRSLALLALAACNGDVDPCAGLGTCIALDIQSSTVERVDHLELDILYGALHSTPTTQPSGGGTADLPLATGIELDITAATEVGLVAAGKLAGTVLGTGAARTTIAPDAHVTLSIELAPVAVCTAGGHYCGGDKLAGDPMTLYTCNAGGVPIARGRCEGGCETRPTDDDVCRGVGGTCIDGGRYCGGDKVDGDPRTLYTCMAGVGQKIRECPDGCVVAPTGQNDDCR